MKCSGVLEQLEQEFPIQRAYNSYTVRDYFNLPEGSPIQLIEGELVMSPSPKFVHQVISRNLSFLIYSHVKEHNLGIVLYSPIDVYLDVKNAYQPDIVFVSNKNKDILKERGLDGSPDMAIEILSPKTYDYDTEIKKKAYERNGVMEYLTVNPETKTINVFRRKSKNSECFDEKTSIKAINARKKLYLKTIDLEIDLKEIFTEY